MKRSFWMSAALLLGLALGARADVWDDDTNGLDDGNGTRNELVSGAVQTHDLAAQMGVADQDWFVVRSRPRSSYELVGEGLTGALSGVPGLTIDLVNAAGTVLATASALPDGGSGFSRSLRWRNDTDTPSTDFVRVSAPSSCNTNCNERSRYTVHFYETTAAVPRFNNTATQTTVLALQNRTGSTMNGVASFWNDTGVLVAQNAFSIPGHGAFVLNTAVSAPGADGNITVTHDGRYGALSGKAYAVEPATGFAYDTALTVKPTN
jgi:hypothetical protein